MTVNISNKAATRCTTTSHQPPRRNQIRFPSADTGGDFGSLIATRPIGHSANPASLKACRPSGKPTTVKQHKSPATRYPRAIHIPAMDSQRMLPIVFKMRFVLSTRLPTALRSASPYLSPHVTTNGRVW